MTRNFWFSCLYLPSSVIKQWFLQSWLCSAKDQIQDSVCAGQALYQQLHAQPHTEVLALKIKLFPKKKITMGLSDDLTRSWLMKTWLPLHFLQQSQGEEGWSGLCCSLKNTSWLCPKCLYFCCSPGSSSFGNAPLQGHHLLISASLLAYDSQLNCYRDFSRVLVRFFTSSRFPSDGASIAPWEGGVPQAETRK